MTLTEITADDAKAHGLPPCYFKVDTSGTALTVTPFPDAHQYLIASGPPGAPLLAIVWALESADADLAAVERAVRRHFAQPWQQPLALYEPATITIAYDDRPALAFSTGLGMRRTGWAGVIVQGRDGAVLVTFGRGIGDGTPTCGEIIAEPSLAAFARTFALRERRMPAPSAVRIRGWSAALAEKAARHRAAGALLGLAVGDALGTTNEFKALSAPAFPELATGPVTGVTGGGPFSLVAGQVTDDTQMAVVLANELLASDHIMAAEVAKGYLAWREVAFDVGSQITQVLDQIASGTAADKAGRAVWEARNRFPAGNGSLMRTAALGVLLAGMDVETRRRATFIDSTITHFDPRCVLACAAFNAAIAHALTEKPSPSSMLRAARAELAEASAQLRLHYADVAPEIEAARVALASDLDAARDDDPQLYGNELHLHKSAGFVRVAFRLAFWELVHAPDYRSAIVDAANRGGDADTNAAIVGALLGAFYGVDGVPADWRDKVLAAPGLAAGKLDLHPRVFLHVLERAYGAA